MKSSKGKLITYQGRKRIDINFPNLYPMVLNAVRHLEKCGLKSGDTVGIICKNNLSWILADLACIYKGIKILALDSDSNLAKYQEKNMHISAMLVSKDYEKESAENEQITYILLEDLLIQETLSEEEKREPHQFQGKDVLSYKSTSGSTGFPKIIGASVQGVENSIHCVQKLFKHSEKDIILVFLPLNLLQQRYWLYSAILFGFTIVVVPKEYFFMVLQQETPTVIMGVPYIYEIIATTYKKSIAKSERLQTDYENYVKDTAISKSFKPFMEYLGGNINYLWTGSAPIATDVLSFYSKMGIPLYQGYGMNETCIISKNYENNNKIGSVGKLFPNIEIKFDDQNQILIKNKYPVCENYTIAALEDRQQFFVDDNYIATGDTGYLDDEGYLFINGRQKEMIALSNSKKIFPSALESKITASEKIENCVFFGDNKPYLTALILPNSTKISHEDVEVIIANYNQQVAPEEKIFKFFLTYEKFSEANNLLTNQHKIKRNKIIEKYKEQFESLYTS
ncbi:AMP-binding protein [Kordia sp.]|uniref:AMP-binding protein n=1 Tax=Kordia sp. TaxID=1965332 RepID=UPI003D27423E